MGRTAHNPERPEDEESATDAVFSSLLEDTAEELYDSAPCGYLSTLMDGTIARINTTLLDWIGLTREQVVGRRRFTDLLTIGGKLYHETHFAPLLRMQGKISEIALELKAAGGGRLPVLVTSSVKKSGDGEPILIRTTLFDARQRRAYEGELLRERQVAEEARRQAEADRERLREALVVLQQSLLPAALPAVPGMEAASYYHTASVDRLGGDFYDLFPLDDKRWAFFLGDVCGKGPQAAAVTSLTRYTLRAAALHDPDPVAALSTLNTVLHQRFTGGDPRYCTAIFGVMEPDPATATVAVRLASGGHPPALVVRADGRADYLPTPGGLLIGILPAPHFTAAETTLGPGDSLLLYTDGLTEARVGENRELYGEDALRTFTAGLARGGTHELIAALTGLLDGFGEGLDDDTALLALGVPHPIPVAREHDLT
ncbi:histidine kinase [Streptomyces virginiae]|uniref:Histidine kinase n=1 Tax=Streptomyces virginiae TaxID=1961 RepID=A0A0L8M2V1_STRVG|nr:SpoIIE family protein phosphatase [Streptomyces virginiae]KOG44715.1 histidine kinase [Streptomyces virginiae]